MPLAPLASAFAAALALVLAAGSLLAGCATDAGFDPLPKGAPPEAVAQRYFELQAAGEERAARDLVWRPERFDGAVPDHSLRGLSDLRVGASREDSSNGRPEIYRGLVEIRELRVEYVRHRRDSVGSPPGEDGRFVLLGRETPGGRWLVIELGTGP